MPRAWSEEEQASVREALLDAGRELFGRLGLRRVAVEELTRAAGIGKGSFYLLFDSKEALFFAVQEREEQALKASVEAEMAPLEAAGDGAALLETLALGAVRTLETHPFLRHVVEPGVVTALLRKLDPMVVAAHRQHDRAWVEGLVERWIAGGLLPATTDHELVFGLFASFFALSLQREVVGDGFDDVVAVLARGMAREIVDGG